MPPPDRRLSVYQIRGLTEAQIWKLGRLFVAGRRTLHGRADVRAAIIHGVGLSVDADNMPVRHANVIGWPEKSKAKLLAQLLANQASLEVRPNGSVR